MNRQEEKHDELKVRPRQRWPNPGVERIKFLKKVKSQFDVRKFKDKASRPPPRKPSRQKPNPQQNLNFKDPLIDELYKSIAERNIKMVKEILNELNTRFVKGGVFNEKAMQAAKHFIRESSSTS